ncbi:hypothetical protein MMC13_006488 [Lambiella insularis]|nr:hypothetical protein [Lambiella insularis]
MAFGSSGAANAKRIDTNGGLDPRWSSSDPSVMVSKDAPEKTQSLWTLHGHIHSDRYSDRNLNRIAALVNYAAVAFKSQVAFMYPASAKPDTDYIPVSWPQFDHVTDLLARHYGKLLQTVIANGQSSGCQPTIALLGLGTTYEYFATQIALQKLNLRTLLLADKSPDDALQHLLSKCHAVALICDLRNCNIAINGLQRVSMVENVLQLPETLEEGELDSIRFEDERDPWERHAFILHSSGSTGMPKAIIHTNRSMMLTARSYRIFPDFHAENWFLLFPLYVVLPIAKTLVILHSISDSFKISYCWHLYNAFESPDWLDDLLASFVMAATGFVDSQSVEDS